MVSEARELPGGFWVVELSRFDEAIASGQRYAGMRGGTLELGLRRAYVRIRLRTNQNDAATS